LPPLTGSSSTRNVKNLHWQPEQVLPIFYRIGKIDPVPEHYTSIGRVEKSWSTAFGIKPTSEVRVGDILAVESQGSFIEFEVESLEIDDQPVEVGEVGAKLGVKFDNSSRLIREKCEIFLVRRPT